MPLILPGNVASATASTGYDVDNSCRFNRASSESLERTPGSAGNRRTFTFSCWFKLGNLASSQSDYYQIFGGFDGSGNDGLWISDSDKLYIYLDSGERRITNQVIRDPSAWYNAVLAIDTTQGTAANRIKLYLNGSEITSFSTNSDPTLNYDSGVNDTSLQNIGERVNDDYFDGYIAEAVLIDGLQLTPTSFGEFDTDGSPTIWKPIDVSGLTFGTNGFYLDFEDSSALGNDVSGNDNDFTVNNLDATDQATDTPTNNFATLNPLNFGHGSLSEGNLKWTASAQVGNLAFGTIGIDMDVSNQFYWETKIEGGEIVIGIAPTTLRWNDTGRAGSYGYYSDGNKYSGTSASSYGASFTTNDIIGVLVGNGTLTFYKNGASQGTAFSSLSGTYLPFLAEVGSTNSMNFGSPPYSISSGNTDPEGYGNFEYSTNSGYALNTKNLAEYG